MTTGTTRPDPATLPDQDARLQRLLGFLQTDPANARLLADALGLAMQLQRSDVVDSLAAHVATHGITASPVHAQLCLHHLLHQRFTEALQAGRAALADGPVTGAWIYNTAWAAFMCGEYAESLHLLQQAFPDPADSPAEANILMARNLHHLEQRDDAIARLSASLEVDADNAEALGLRALIADDNGDYDLAIADARKALALVPDQPDALLALGDALKAGEDYSGAALAYRQLCERDPRSGRAWSGLAQVQMSELELDAAEQSATLAVEHMTDHIGTWHVLAWIHILKGNPAAARRALESSLAIDRSFADTHGGLAVVDVMEGRRDDAERKIRIAEKLDRNAMAVQYARLLLLQQDNDSEGARALVASVLARQAPASDQTGLELVQRRIRALLKSRTLH